MPRLNHPNSPADVFEIHDRVECTNPRSIHYGYPARVLGMGKTRLNVAFENGHAGKFMDWRDAKLISRPIGNSSVSPANISVAGTERSDSESLPDLEELTGWLEHAAFTAAILISSHHADPEHMDELLVRFNGAVRTNAFAVAYARQNG